MTPSLAGGEDRLHAQRVLDLPPIEFGDHLSYRLDERGARRVGDREDFLLGTGHEDVFFLLVGLGSSEQDDVELAVELVDQQTEHGILRPLFVGKLKLS